jgi:lipase
MTLATPTTSLIHVRAAAHGMAAADGVNVAFGFWPGRQRPLVAIHGITGNHAQFFGLGVRLAGRRALLAVDLRGRGDSDKPEGPYSMHQHARDIVAVMRNFRLEPSVVVGHSMGAYIGAEVAAIAPELVSGLVIFDGGLPLPAPPDVSLAEFADKLIAPAMARLSMTFPNRQAYLDYWRAQPTFIDTDWTNGWVEEYFDSDLGGEPPTMRPKPLESAIRVDWLSMVDREAALARLHRVQAPVLVLRAEHGMARGQPPVLPENLMQEMRAIFPHMEEYALAGTTHYTSCLADPGISQVADLVVDFAERHGA